MVEEEIDPLMTFEVNDRHANILLLWGKPRVGKSRTASLMTRILLARGFAVITTLRFRKHVLKKYDHLHYVTTDRQYFEAYLKVPKGMPIILIWDDAQASEGMKSMDVIKKEGGSLIKFLIFIGKFDTNLMFIAHMDYIPGGLLQGQPVFIYLLERYYLFFGGRKHFNIRDEALIRNNCDRIQIPDIEPLDYQTKTPAAFDFVLDLNDMFQYLAAYEGDSDDLREAVQKYLERSEEMDKFKQLRSMTWEEISLALLLKNPDLDPNMKLYELFKGNRGVFYKIVKKYQSLFQQKYSKTNFRR